MLGFLFWFFFSKNGEGEGNPASREEILYGGVGAINAVNVDDSAINASGFRDLFSPHRLRRGFVHRRSHQTEALELGRVIFSYFSLFVCLFLVCIIVYDFCGNIFWAIEAEVLKGRDWEKGASSGRRFYRGSPGLLSTTISW